MPEASVTPVLRLLLVIDSLRSGGAQRQLVTLAQGLCERGHQVEFFYYSPEAFFATALEQAHIPVHFHGRSRRYSTEVLRNLREVIRRGAYDGVLSYLDGPNFYVLLATRGLAHTPKVIVSERFYDPPEGVSWRQRLPRLMYRFADCVVTNSHHQRQTLESKCPWLVGRTSTILNGVDLNSFRPAKRPAAGPPRLLAVGSVAPYKNGLCLVHALPILAQRYGLLPTVSWVGEHVMEAAWGDYSLQMQRAIAEFQLEDRWTWLHQRHDIAELMASHDALVHPSYGEGLPNVVCEALASGLPVIVSNTLDHPRLVEHGVSGYLFDWRDPQDLAQCIRAFSELSDAQRGEMSRNARSFAEKNLALPTFIKQYEDLFLSLVSSSA